MQALKECVPHELYDSGKYKNTKAFSFLNINVIATHHTPWIGTHKNVIKWWELENGYVVAWNENSIVGWSFPVKKIKT